MGETQMKKAPPNTPERGDRCRMRGRPGHVGRLIKYDPATNWATVVWDIGPSGPQTVHRFELERVTDGR
jgi:hypothetical protein